MTDDEACIEAGFSDARDAQSELIERMKLIHGLTLSGFESDPMGMDANAGVQFAVAIIWLRHRDRTSRATSRNPCSYSLKHVIEAWSRNAGGLAYVSNGAVIAAADYVGLRYHRNGRNANIGIRRAAIQEVA